MSTLIANATENYFNKQISPKDWARLIRKYNYAVTEVVMRMQAKTGEMIELDSIIDGIYYTNSLAELIDPYLDEEEI